MELGGYKLIIEANFELHVVSLLFSLVFSNYCLKKKKIKEKLILLLGPQCFNASFETK